MKKLITSKFNELSTSKRAFTLVELIVVIVILAILWTIAFISFQGYSRNSRDSVRIADIWNIVKSLQISIAKWWKVPIPENKIDITASGILIWYQWEMWDYTLKNVLWIFNWWKDPLENTNYTYATNDELTKYQIIWFLENWNNIWYDINLTQKAQAIDLIDRYIYIRWDELWVILDKETNEPINKLGINLDIAKTEDEYKTIFASSETVDWTWWEIFSEYYNRNADLLTNKELANLDKSLVLYMDMETTTTSWSTIILKDFSRYQNNGYCYNSWTIVDCWWAIWPQFENNWMYFDWINKQRVEILDNEKMEFWSNGTVLIKFNIKWLSWLWTNSLDYAKFLSKDDTLHLCSNTYAFNIHVTLLANPNYNTSLNTNKPWYLNNVFCDTFIPALWNYIVNNTFNTISYIYDKWSLAVYLDKINIYTNNNDNFLLKNTIDNWKIWAWHLYYLNWNIDEIRMYNRALSDIEIKAIYESMK